MGGLSVVAGPCLRATIDLLTTNHRVSRINNRAECSAGSVMTGDCNSANNDDLRVRLMVPDDLFVPLERKT